MFGLVSRFLGQFWEGVLPEEDKNTETKENKGLLAVESKEEHCITNLRKCFSGKVTKLYDDSGMIDDDVFFKFKDVIGGIRLRLNTEVHVEARRTRLDDAWQADRVEVFTNWDSFGEEGTLEVLIGEVTEITGDNFIVNYDTYCNLSCVTVGYVVCKGDWVRVELMKDRGVVCEIKSVGPLREKTITGSITSISQGHGYINTDIFFSFGACRRNYIPRKGHNVLVTAIESNQGNCKWRALRIEPRTPNRGQRDSELTRTAPLLESRFIKELVCDKQGVIITDEVNFGDVIVGEVQEKLVCIRNDGESVVVLKSVDGFTDDSVFSIELTEKLNLVGKQALDIHIDPQNMLQLKAKVNSRLLGEMNKLVVFNFGAFQIGCYFVVNVQDVQQCFLDAKTPFHKRKFVDKKNALMRVVNLRNNKQWVIPGERPMFKQTTINFSSKLKHYEIPMTLRQYILDKIDLCCRVPSLIEPLSMRNYKERFSTLLHAEEVQMELEMREFDLEQVSLKNVGDLLGLSVPGLAEGRPSLLIGDRVILSVSGGSHNAPKYEGFIHEVLNDEILLKFHDDFHATYDMDSYDVMFFFNRTPLRRAHKAVEMANYIGDQVLFPTCVTPILPQTLRAKKDLYNSKLNERQKSAVARILSGQCRPMPYVLFGPPGTGKTVTLVEAILQVFHCVGFSRILACTPSNSAADLIAERLHHSGGIADGDMIRLNAFQRQQNIPEDIENYSTSIERLDMAAHYRIVICTCTTAGQLHTLGLPPGHFTHVFIDEAGQATEPESLVPICFLAGTQGQVILGGDPYQLGPVLRSTISQSYGLDMSLLERLMMRTPYLRNEETFSNHGCYDALVVTKLVCNYRCHEALLELPSRLFYHAEMVSCVDETIKNCLCDWDTLPNQSGFPIIFHGVKGEDLREGNSPSWFNAVEAVQVIRYVKELQSFKKHPVKLEEIGIITPYRKQVEKIRLLLDRLGMNGIKVGSVEEFQGQERLVIIISTVRSSCSLLGFDLSHNLGFLSNPKRFNVAITRAQALMIIVGNPHVLYKDTNWCALLKYCLDNNGYIGCDLPVLGNGIREMDENMDEGNGGINDEENGENIDEQTYGSDVIGDAENREDIRGSCSDRRGDDELDSSRVVKTGSEFNDEKSPASRTLCKMTGDNMNTEGKYVTSGGLPGDTIVHGGDTKEDEVARAINEVRCCLDDDRVESEESRFFREEGKNESFGEKIVSRSFLLNQHADVVETGIHGSRNHAADKNINFNGNAESCVLQTEVLRVSESSDEELEEIVYTPYSRDEIIF